MSALNVKTPGRGNGAGVGEAGEAGNLEAKDTTQGATTGRGLRAYEAAKRDLLALEMAPAEYAEACRLAAQRAGV